MNTPQNDGGGAFPYIKTDECIESYYGMTLLDWFAGQALPAAIEWQRLWNKEEIYRDGFDGIHDQPCLPDYDSNSKQIAICCYSIAEAMIAERNRL